MTSHRITAEELTRLWLDLANAASDLRSRLKVSGNGSASEQMRLACTEEVARLLHQIVAPFDDSACGIECRHVTFGATPSQAKRFVDSLDAAADELWRSRNARSHDPLAPVPDQIDVYEQWRRRFGRMIASAELMPPPPTNFEPAVLEREPASDAATEEDEVPPQSLFDAGQVWVPAQDLQELLRHVAGTRWGVREIPAAFSEGTAQNPHRVSGAFDPNVTMSAFKRVRLLPGYRLDYVWGGNHHQGSPLVYARQESELPLETVEDFASKFWVKPEGFAPHYPEAFCFAVEFDDHPMGAVEFAVFVEQIWWFYWHWHAFYARYEIVTSESTRSSQYEFLDKAGREVVDRVPLGARVRWANGQAHVETLAVSDGWYSLKSWTVAHPAVLLRTQSRQLVRPAVIRFY